MKKVLSMSLIALAATVLLAVHGVQAETLPRCEGAPHVGKVLTVLNVPQYTYAEISEKGKTFWIACPTTPLKRGMTVGFGEGAPQTNFHSKTLNRTFKTILFVEKCVPCK